MLPHGQAAARYSLKLRCEAAFLWCCRDGSIDYEEFAAMMRQTDAELVNAVSFFKDRAVTLDV